MGINRLKPDFIIAGAAKSGTTALHGILDQHPQIHMSPIKETNYFSLGYDDYSKYRQHNGTLVFPKRHDQLIDTPERYQAQFCEDCYGGHVFGESSPLYLLQPEIAQRIYDFNPQMKLVFMLRAPAKVAYANCLHQIRDGVEALSFEQIDKMLEPDHYNKGDLHPFAHHLELPKYSQHLKRFYDLFPSCQILVMIYEEFLADRATHMKRILQFIECDPYTDFDDAHQVNVSGLPKNKAFHKFLLHDNAAKLLVRQILPMKFRRRIRERLERMNIKKAPAQPADMMHKLHDLYLQDIQYVEEKLGRDLPAWR